LLLDQLVYNGLMPLLAPDWNQPRPTTKDVLEMCRHIRLTALEVAAQPFGKFIEMIRTERRNGGAYLKAFEVGPDPVFDWFASRNRLWDERLLDWLVLHPTIAQSFPELRIPDSPRGKKGSETKRAILGVIAIAAGLLTHGKFLVEYSEDELLEMEP
jgi:hypothetical protein